MPTNYTDVDEFTEPVVLMADADPANGESVRVPLRALANRTRFLVEQIGGPEGNQNWEFASPRLRYKTLTFAKAMFPQDVSGNLLWRKQLSANEIHHVPMFDEVFAVLDLEPAHLSTIQTIEVWLSTSSGRGTASDRWQISLWRQGVDDTGPYTEVSGFQQGSTVDDNGADGYTKVTLTHSLAVDRQNYTYTLRVRAPDSVASGDFLHKVRLGFDQTSPEGGY